MNSGNLWRRLTVFGMLSSVAYLTHVLVGGILWEGYNHLMQPISDLTAAGAPNRALVSNILLLYGPPAIIYAFCALKYLMKFAPKISQIGMLIYLFMQALSLSYGMFPEDLVGEPQTFKGVMHMVVTGLIVPLTILSPLLIGLGLRKVKEFRALGIYSIITGIFIFFAGGTAAMFFANKLPYFGLVERINIGSLQLWMFVTAYLLFKTNLKSNDYVTLPMGSKDEAK